MAFMRMRCHEAEVTLTFDRNLTSHYWVQIKVYIWANLRKISETWCLSHAWMHKNDNLWLCAGNLKSRDSTLLNMLLLYRFYEQNKQGQMEVVTSMQSKGDSSFIFIQQTPSFHQTLNKEVFEFPKISYYLFKMLWNSGRGQQEVMFLSR